MSDECKEMEAAEACKMRLLDMALAVKIVGFDKNVLTSRIGFMKQPLRGQEILCD